MGLLEPRCLVCGAALDKWAAMDSLLDNDMHHELCSDECYDIYMTEDENEREELISKMGESA